MSICKTGEEQCVSLHCNFDPLARLCTVISLCLYFRRGIALACLGGPIYAVGGLDDSTCFNTVERFDPESDTWTFVASMNTHRGGVGVASLNVSYWDSTMYKQVHDRWIPLDGIGVMMLFFCKVMNTSI